jgi:tRNA (guanine37-N1)-methyltransferase
MRVHEVLLSGNHREISRWRKREAIKRTLQRRPDLLKMAELNEEDKEILEDINRGLCSEKIHKIEK